MVQAGDFTVAIWTLIGWSVASPLAAANTSSRLRGVSGLGWTCDADGGAGSLALTTTEGGIEPVQISVQ